MKRQILSLLKMKPIDVVLSEVRGLPPRQVVSALIPALCYTDLSVKWHAVTALGQAMTWLAEEDIEAARVVIRRLTWSLNEESGGVGWGAPEALGEILAVYPAFADEYAFALVSYMRKDGPYLELPILQRGLLWGVGRLADTQPDTLLKLEAPSHVLPYLDSQDPEIRGLAARVLGRLRFREAESKLASLENDPAEFVLYTHEGFRKTTVRAVVQEALGSLHHIEAV